MDSGTSIVEPPPALGSEAEAIQPTPYKSHVRGDILCVSLHWAAVIVPLAIIPIILIPHTVLVIQHSNDHHCASKSLGMSSIALQIFLCIGTSFFAVMTSKESSASTFKYAIATQVGTILLWFVGLLYFAPVLPPFQWKFSVDMLDSGCEPHDKMPRKTIDADHHRQATIEVCLMGGGIALSILSIVLLCCLRRGVKRAMRMGARTVSFEPTSAVGGHSNTHSDPEKEVLAVQSTMTSTVEADK